MHSVTTRTRASTIAGLAALALIGVGLVLPAFAPRSLIQDLFFILTMLTLAQLWNLIAGFGGMVSVGQQAFVGIGAYAMFAAVILWGLDPVPAILLAAHIATAANQFGLGDLAQFLDLGKKFGTGEHDESRKRTTPQPYRLFSTPQALMDAQSRSIG